ncbi:MAG: ABC transporter permease, partial [Clostridia bacterium]|nr:ABC transporter permease [Clostridia bacterium]
MKKTQFIDCIRNIAKQKVSFLSIILIAVMGVTAYLGIGYTATALRKNGSDIYDSLNFRDIEMVSTLLFTEKDIQDISKVKGVKDVEPIRYTGAKLCYANERESVNVISVSKRINLSVSVKGRLPKGNNECAIEQKTADELGLKVGDNISLLDVKGNTAEYLKNSEYVITGIAKHADHTNILVPGLAYVFVNMDAFDSEALDGAYMKAEVVIDKPDKINRFSKEYDNLVDKVMKRIEKLSVTNTERRLNEVKSTAGEEITNGEKTLDEALKQLEEARRLLDDKAKELKVGEEKAIYGERQLLAAKAELDKAKAKLDSGKQELINGFAEIEDAKSQIRNAVKETYEQIFTSEEDRKLINWAGVKTADIDNPSETAKYFDITDTVRLDLSKKIEDVLAPVIDTADIPEELLVAIYEFTQKADAPKSGGVYDIDAIKETLLQTAATAIDGYTKLSNACIEWDNGHSEYISGVSLYNEQKDKYEQGVRELILSRKLLEDGKVKIAEGEAEYKNSLAEYDEGKLKLEDAKKQFDEIEQCKWLLFDSRGNASFVQMIIGSENFSNIKMTFSLLFVAVGALVIVATVGKIVDEQRSEIGTTKALGFFNREIFAKYIVFGVSATIIGAFLSIAAAYYIIEPMMLNGFAKYYWFDISKPTVDIIPAVVAIIASIVLSFVSVWFASVKLLSEPAVRLMQPKMPGATKKTGGKGRLSLYSRLILLNMKTD